MNYISKNILFISISIFLALSFSRDYKDLNIDFLLDDTTATIKKKQGPSSKNASKKRMHFLYKNTMHFVRVILFCIKFH